MKSLWLTTLLCFCSSSIGAQIHSLVVVPARVEKIAYPGEIINDGFRVRNPAPTTSHVSVRVVDLWVTEDLVVLLGPRPECSRSSVSWLKVTPSEMEMAPNSEQLVRFTACVPQGIRTGAYWSAIQFTAGPSLMTRQTTDAGYCKASIVVPTILTVGSPLPSLRPAALSVEEVAGKAVALLTLENTGEGCTRTKGQFVVRNAAGIETCRFPVPEMHVLPGARIRLRADCPTELPVGDYTLTASLDFGTVEIVVCDTGFRVERSGIVRSVSQP